MGEVRALQRPTILTPQGTLNKLEHTIPAEEFVKLRRLMGWARTHGMIAMYFCPLCDQPIRLTQDQPVQLTDGSGMAAPVQRLDCSCQRWTVR